MSEPRVTLKTRWLAIVGGRLPSSSSAESTIS